MVYSFRPPFEKGNIGGFQPVENEMAKVDDLATTVLKGHTTAWI